MTVGEKIKYFRKHMGITSAKLAEQTGIHPVSIRKYETDKAIPQFDQVEKIANAFGISAVTFSEFNSDKNISLETYGDLIGLLIMLCKNGIILMAGNRDDKGFLTEESIVFKISPLIGQHIHNGKGSANGNNWCLTDKAVLKDLIKWERVYTDYKEMVSKYGDTLDENIRTAVSQLKGSMDKIEIELQRSSVLLDQKNGISVKISPDYLGSD